MRFQVIPTETFVRNVRYYIKKKKYTHIGKDIKTVTDELEKGNLIGDEIPDLKIEASGQTFKVRAVNSDTQDGKSNGYRIIYYAIKEDFEIYLLTIYYKKDGKNIPTNAELVELVRKFCL